MKENPLKRSQISLLNEEDEAKIFACNPDELALYAMEKPSEGPLYLHAIWRKGTALDMYAMAHFLQHVHSYDTDKLIYGENMISVAGALLLVGEDEEVVKSFLKETFTVGEKAIRGLALLEPLNEPIQKIVENNVLEVFAKARLGSEIVVAHRNYENVGKWT